jgi:predicted peroxiredoxin
MPFMSGLTIIVASGDPARFAAALEIAAANAALGRRTRLFLQSDAVQLLRQDAASNTELLGEAIALGASITLCQSGLALAGMTADRLPAGVETGGLVELLATSGDDQLLMA